MVLCFKKLPQRNIFQSLYFHSNSIEHSLLCLPLSISNPFFSNFCRLHHLLLYLITRHTGLDTLKLQGCCRLLTYYSFFQSFLWLLSDCINSLPRRREISNSSGKLLQTPCWINSRTMPIHNTFLFLFILSILILVFVFLILGFWWTIDSKRLGFHGTYDLALVLENGFLFLQFRFFYLLFSCLLFLSCFFLLNLISCISSIGFTECIDSWN